MHCYVTLTFSLSFNIITSVITNLTCVMHEHRRVDEEIFNVNNKVDIRLSFRENKFGSATYITMVDKKYKNFLRA